MFFIFRETTRSALMSILPRNDHITSLEELDDFEGFRLYLKEGFPAIIRIMLTFVSVIIWQMSPIFTIGLRSRATNLNANWRDKHTEALVKHRYYYIRHAMSLLKAFAMLHWGRSDIVRNEVGIKLYETDPTSCREGSDLRSGNHISYRSREEPIGNIQVDAVIVGSGPGGVSVAERLAGAGLRVLIVEAGPYLEPKDYPYSTLGAMRSLLLEKGILGAFGKSMSTVLAGRAVGGGSVVNSGIIVHTPEDIFRSLSQEYGLELPMRDIMTYEDELAHKLKTGVLPDMVKSGTTHLIDRAARKLQLHDHDILKNMPNCIGSGQCLQGCRAGKKQSLNIWIDELIKNKNVFLYSSAEVSNFEFKNGKIVALHGKFIHHISLKSGAKFSVTPSGKLRRKNKGLIVILAGGAVSTPLILSKSGINLPMVGKNFLAHPGSPMQAVYRNGINTLIGSTQDWSSMVGRDAGYKLETCRVPLTEVASARFPGAGRNFASHLTNLKNSVTTISVARGRYSSGSVKRLPDGNRLIRYDIDPRDVESVRQGLYDWARIHFEAGARYVYPGIYGIKDMIYPGEERQILSASNDPRNYVTVLSHLLGTACMGVDSDHGVCDSGGRVFNMRGLYIADSSLFPMTLGVNPQLTIMGFATYVAETVLRDNFE